MENPENVRVEVIGQAAKVAVDAIQKYSIVRPATQSPTSIIVEVQSLLATEISVAQALGGKLGAGVKVSKVEEF